MLGQALGAGGADIVGVQHLDHAAARQPRDDGDLRQRQHDHRQDHVAPARRRSSRRPAAKFVAEQMHAIDAEDQRQDGRGDEGGNGDADHGDRHHRIVVATVLVAAPRMVPRRMPRAPPATIADRPSRTLTGRPSAISCVTVKSLFL